MKTRKLIKRLYGAILEKRKDDVSKVYGKLIKKSLKGKHTEAVR